MVAVVLVRADGVAAEPAVGRRIDGQRIVVPHEDRLAVASDRQLGWERSIEGPDGLVALCWHQGMKADRHARRRSGQRRARNGRREHTVIEAARSELAAGVAMTLVP